MQDREEDEARRHAPVQEPPLAMAPAAQPQHTGEHLPADDPQPPPMATVTVEDIEPELIDPPVETTLL